MPSKGSYKETLKGLTTREVLALQNQSGPNMLRADNQHGTARRIMAAVREPMFLLLLAACMLYFLSGEMEEGFLMLAAMLIVLAISIYQDARSSRALRLLQQYTAPKVRVLRDGQQVVVDSRELVPGDILFLEEGNTVPADALVLDDNDLTANEAIITGESFPANKQAREGFNKLYQGTTINSGKCIARVTATGHRTVLGQLGKSVATYATPKTLLQQQVGKAVKRLAIFGISAFAVIWLINYLKSGLLTESLLYGLTLAMAAVPEEIPVAFSSFMALGAYRLSRLGIITRQPQIIENLGAVNVICLDKTGTITENKMTVKTVYDLEDDKLTDLENAGIIQEQQVLLYGMLASEKDPFDSMEKAIHEAYRLHVPVSSEMSLEMVHEYPLAGTPPMMTHVYRHATGYVAAAKGAVEKIMAVCQVDQEATRRILKQVQQMAEKGYRVLGVASAIHTSSEMPAQQESFNWKMEGLLCLYDPPRKNMQAVIRELYEAGIHIKLLTGDYPATAVSIAQQVGIKGYLSSLSGDQVMAMDQARLQEAVRTTTVFVRMLPEAKLKVIHALKANGNIVAMTGDGVNDAPALKAADIGISMGKDGTAIARETAALVLTDDRPERLTEAIRQGRKVRSNLQKAIRYIISIHIPVILVASLPLVLGWRFPTIFTPIHIIFLELIMGPTCSLFYEKEPVEEGSMQEGPAERAVFFREDELLISITQGLVITGGILTLYYYFMSSFYTLESTRTIVFTTLLLSNIFLTFTNRSFTENFLKTIRYKNKLAPWVVAISLGFLFSIYFIPEVQTLFGLASISFTQWLLCAGVALATVGWFEIYKTHLMARR